MKHVELQEFFVEGTDQKASHVLLHITEPSTPQEHKKGYFFAIVEINEGSIRHIEMIQQVIDDIEAAYYEGNNDTHMQFEIALECMNRRSDEILKDKELEIHALVGVLRGYDLSFAYRGEITTILSYKQQNKYLSMNITQDQDLAAQKIQLFPNLMQGTINPGDYLYIGSPNVERYISRDRIEKLVLSRSLGQTSAHIEKVLTDLSSDLSFGGIFFHTLPKTKKMITEQNLKKLNKQGGSEASLDKLISSKQATEDTLSPPLIKEMVKKFKALKNKKKTSLDKTKRGTVETNYRSRVNTEQIPDQGFGNTALIMIGRGLVYSGLFIWKTLKAITLFISQLSISLFILITNKNNNRKEIIRQVQKNIESQKRRLESLTMVSKLLFILLLIALVIFGFSMITMKISNHYATKNETYNQLIQAINQKKDEAEARMIYRDDKSALVLLQEAKSLAGTINESNKEKKETKANLLQEINNELFKLQKVEFVSSELVVDLTEQNLRLQSIGLIENTLVAFGPESKEIAIINVFDKSVTKKQNESVEGLVKATTPKEEDDLSFISNQNKVARFNKQSQALNASDIAYPNEEVDIIDASIYNTRLYALDKKNNTIYKHSKIQTGFDKGSIWLKDNADFSTAVSLTIDGKIYVLHSDGLVNVFEKGRAYDFELQNVDPRIAKATQIWTYAEVDEIYIFEPAQKRIVVYNKQGTLIKQIKSESWQNPSSMVIDYDNSQVFVLDGNVVYKAAIK